MRLHGRPPVHSPRRQRGMSILGMLTIGIMVGFFVMSGIKIAPGYVEYLAVRDIMIEAAESYKEDETRISDIRRTISMALNTNQIKLIGPRDVDISRKDGRIVIDANFEHRIDLVWRIDAVVVYDDLVFVAGERYSD